MRTQGITICLDSACRLSAGNESIKSFSGARLRFSEKVFRVLWLFSGAFQ